MHGCELGFVFPQIDRQTVFTNFKSSRRMLELKVYVNTWYHIRALHTIRSAGCPAWSRACSSRAACVASAREAARFRGWQSARDGPAAGARRGVACEASHGARGRRFRPSCPCRIDQKDRPPGRPRSRSGRAREEPPGTVRTAPKRRGWVRGGGDGKKPLMRTIRL